MAQVSQNVYDTATGKYLLIPQGTRLIGAYSSDVAFGQERVLMAWQRLIFPDGKALDIRAMPGADSAGYAGFSDKVNSHWFRTISSAVLMSGVIAAVDMSRTTVTQIATMIASGPVILKRGTWSDAWPNSQSDHHQKPQYLTHPRNQTGLSLQRHGRQRHVPSRLLPRF